VTRICKAHGVYDQISQLVVAYLHILVSGVRGDRPCRGGIGAYRPFRSLDFMTGEGIYLPEPVVREIGSTLTKDRRIGRSMQDITSKPPGRTEYE
jgi:GMP synthase PP-ATPase subunit